MSFWAYRVVSRLDFEEIMEEKQNWMKLILKNN
jgi:hypothetical protein